MDLNKKSKTTAFLLALLLGPFGVMYGNVLIGFIMLVIMLITSPTVIMPLVMWLFCMPIAVSAVNKHNEAVDKFIEVMKAR